MRSLARVVVGIAVLLGVALAALTWLLPRWLESGDFRARLAAAARDATGREVVWGGLSVGILPPRLLATQVRVGDAGAPLLEAERVALRVDLAPLVARRIEVDSLVLDGVTWRIARTPAGLALPIAPVAVPGPATPAPPAPAPAAPAAPLRLGLRDVEAHGSRVVWDDSVAAPPVRIELRDVEARAHGGGDAPVALSLAGTLAGGGSLQVAGSATPAGALDLEATLAGADLAALAPYFGRGLALAGHVGGKLRARGPASALEALDADLELADANVRAGEVSAQGPVALRAHLRGSLAAPEGDFELDATRAALAAYGGAFRKPPGAPANATGKLVRDPNGKLGVDSVHLQIKNMNGTATLTPNSVGFDASPFDLSGWGELVPALAPLAPAGELALEGVRVTSAPFALAGRARLDGVRLQPAGRPPVPLRGALVGEGQSLRSESLVATVGGQAIPISLRLDDLGGAPRQSVSLAVRDADVQALIAALFGKRDVLEGPLTASAQLGGPLGAPLAGLAGDASLAIGPGRIPNLSPLGSALDALGRFREAAQLIDRARAERSLAPYLGDRFQSISGRFAIGAGRAHTDALVLRYPGYQLELRGSVGLADQDLDLAGRVVLDSEIEAALAGRPPAPGQSSRTIEVARVRGTAAAPKLEVDQAGAVEFAATFALAQSRDKLEKRLDKQLGAGAGGAIVDALDQLLGKKEKR